MRFIIGAGRWTEIGADVHVLAEGKWTGTQGKTPAAEPMLEAEAMSCPGPSLQALDPGADQSPGETRSSPRYTRSDSCRPGSGAKILSGQNLKAVAGWLLPLWDAFLGYVVSIACSARKLAAQGHSRPLRRQVRRSKAEIRRCRLIVR